MKKIIVIALLFGISSSVSACDICGCGSGSDYIGILPEFRNHVFGIRYKYNFLQTHLGAGGNVTYLSTRETYRSAEIWGGWNITRNFRLMASVPYSFNERVKEAEAKQSKSGIGDVTIAGYYQPLNKRNTVNNKLLIQSLWVGAAVKLPTGKYNPADKENAAANTNLFQLGTASTDVSFNFMYDLRLQDAGLNIAGNYRLNNENKYGYAYGDKQSLHTQLYYKLRVLKNKLLVAPNIGLLLEHSERDKDNGYLVDISGGKMMALTAGLELSLKTFSAGFNFQDPIQQQLGRGAVKAGSRGMVYLAAAF